MTVANQELVSPQNQEAEVSAQVRLCTGQLAKLARTSPTITAKALANEQEICLQLIQAVRDKNDTTLQVFLRFFGLGMKVNAAQAAAIDERDREVVKAHLQALQNLTPHIGDNGAALGAYVTISKQVEELQERAHANMDKATKLPMLMLLIGGIAVTAISFLAGRYSSK